MRLVAKRRKQSHLVRGNLVGAPRQDLREVVTNAIVGGLLLEKLGVVCLWLPRAHWTHNKNNITNGTLFSSDRSIYCLTNVKRDNPSRLNSVGRGRKR